MKKSKLKVVLVSLVCLFLLLFGGVFYYASTQISPEKFKAIAESELQQLFPNAEIKIGKIDISLGLSAKVNINKLNMRLKSHDHDELINVEDTVVKIPLWSILTRGGTVALTITQPDLYYKEIGESNNWILAMGKKTAHANSAQETKQNHSEKNTKNQSENNSVALPAFLSRVKMDIKLFDMNVNYALKDNSNGRLKLNRMVVNNLGLSSITAFELDSLINVKLNPKESVSFKSLVIGQFNLSEFLSHETINSAMVIKLSEIKLPSGDEFPDVKTDLKVKLNKKGEMGGDFACVFGSSKMNGNYKIDEENVALSSLAVDVQISDVAVLPKDLASLVQLDKGKFKLDGNFTLSKNGSKNPDIKFSLSPGINIKVDNNLAYLETTGSFKGKKLKVDTVVKVFEGKAEVVTTANLDLNQKNIGAQSLDSLRVDIRLDDMKVKKELIQSKMYAEKPKEQDKATAHTSASKMKGDNVASNSVDQKKQNKTPPLLMPTGLINFSMNRIKVGEENLSGTGLVKVAGNKVAIEKFKFNFSEGDGSLTDVTTLGENKQESVFNLDLNRINLKGFNAFLPPQLNSISGIFSGKVNGNVKKINEDMNYDVTLNLVASKGELKGIDLSEKVQALVASVPLISDKFPKGKKIIIDENFETLSVKGNFKNQIYDVKEFVFNGINKKVEITGNGKVFPPPQKQSADVVLELLDNSGNISNVLEKNVGTKILPMKLVGPGFDLKPDYKYTISKLAKSGYKNKVKAKVEEKAKDEVKKLLEDKVKSKDVNKLLKGLFR